MSTCEHGETKAHYFSGATGFGYGSISIGCRGPQSHCRAGCPTKDHATWGDCARAARIQVDRAALAAGRLDTKRAAQ